MGTGLALVAACEATAGAGLLAADAATTRLEAAVRDVAKPHAHETTLQLPQTRTKSIASPSRTWDVFGFSGWDASFANLARISLISLIFSLPIPLGLQAHGP
jgi:hypothetical protein